LAPIFLTKGIYLMRTRIVSEKLKNAYESTAKFSVAPLALSVKLITEEDKRTGGFDVGRGLPKLIGVFSLPWTILATAVTLPVGVLGLAAITTTTPAIPVAMLLDTVSPVAPSQEDTNENLSSFKLNP
jgi:hypothetical protein